MSSEENKETKSSSDSDSGVLADVNAPMESPSFAIPMKINRLDKDKDTLLPPSPPKFVSMNQLAEAAKAFYNMTLVHEITVDSHFRLEMYEPHGNTLEYQIKETMHRAFWDILRSSLESDPPDYQPALRLLEEIKQSLTELVLPNQTKLQKLIENLLDIDVAKSQLDETGHISLEVYKNEVINLMKQFCAPVRDQEVEDLRKIDDPVESFRNVFLLLDKMHMDLANFTIEQMRPYIRQQAVTYERDKFATFIEAQQKLGIDGLRHTRDWIKQAYADVNSLSQQSNECSNSINSSGVKPTKDNSMASLTPNNILREAYLKLLTWPRDQDWPETMLMDQHRLVDLGNQLIIIVNLTSLVLVVCNYMASNASLFTTPPATTTSGALSSAAPPTKTIFSHPLSTSLPQDAIIQLKKSICQDVAPILHGISLNYKPDQLVDDIIEQVIMTIELWYNRCMLESGGSSSSSSSGASQLPSTNLSCESSPTVVNDYHKPATGGGGVAYITDFGRTELTGQLSAVIKGEHPVYKLMQPLPLPPGFSILLDLDQNKLSTTTSNNGAAYLHQTPLNIPTTMMSGSGGANASAAASTSSSSNLRSPSSPPPSSPHNRLRHESESGGGVGGYKASKFEILSLSGLASRLLPLLAHNRHVFGSYYAEIIQPLIMPTTSSPSSSAAPSNPNVVDKK
uniref:Uncharacterized protein n=1 Tax=Trichobilharzia regenti TaxID=157069 RepID=A0AA85J405_TRIRE|nr:unnamed protein product [Trichobilharzia regenti]